MEQDIKQSKTQQPEVGRLLEQNRTDSDQTYTAFFSEAVFVKFAKRISEMSKQDVYLRNILSKQKPGEWGENFLQGKKVTRKMRKKVVKWMLQLCDSLELKPSTCFESISILDSYLAKVEEEVSNLQLAAATCIFIGTKLHESKVVSAEVFVFSCSNIFTKQQLYYKQESILANTGWRFGANPYRLLRQLCNDLNTSEGIKQKCVELLRIAIESVVIYKYSWILVSEVILLMAQDQLPKDEQSIQVELQLQLKAASSIKR